MPQIVHRQSPSINHLRKAFRAIQAARLPIRARAWYRSSCAAIQLHHHLPVHDLPWVAARFALAGCAGWTPVTAGSPARRTRSLGCCWRRPRRASPPPSPAPRTLRTGPAHTNPRRWSWLAAPRRTRSRYVPLLPAGRLSGLLDHYDRLVLEGTVMLWWAWEPVVARVFLGKSASSQ